MSDVRERKTTIEASFSNVYVRISLLGLVATLALLVDPLDSLADQNLTVHMFQHIGLFTGAAVFGYGLERYLSTHLVQLRKKFSLGYSALLSVIKFNTRTKGLVFAVLVPSFVFSYWHFPPNFDLAVVNGYVHILEHFSYIIAGSLVGLSIIAIPRKLRVILLAIGFMQAGMMGSLMTLGTSFYTAYSATQNMQMGTAIMLFGAAGILITSSWLAKVLDIL
ncbi:MAG: cytochrome c oxidase assembly protein [Nitrososphaerales archaeon]